MSMWCLFSPPVSLDAKNRLEFDVVVIFLLSCTGKKSKLLQPQKIIMCAMIKLPSGNLTVCY